MLLELKASANAEFMFSGLNTFMSKLNLHVCRDITTRGSDQQSVPSKYLCYFIGPTCAEQFALVRASGVACFPMHGDGAGICSSLPYCVSTTKQAR
jgi:hypothetical protein